MNVQGTAASISLQLELELHGGNGVGNAKRAIARAVEVVRMRWAERVYAEDSGA